MRCSGRGYIEDEVEVKAEVWTTPTEGTMRVLLINKCPPPIGSGPGKV
jgi:hypothetical protein